MKSLIYVLCLLLFYSCVIGERVMNPNQTRMVCNDNYMMKKAQRTIIRKYGIITFYRFKPYIIKDYNKDEKNTTKIVIGTFNGCPNAKGGTPVVFINKNTCEIIRVTHEK